MKNQYGIMIRLLREKMSIPMEQLSRGLFSIAELSRIETGEKEMTRPVHEALLQRMGKSIDKLESILSEEEYVRMIFKEKFIESALESEWNLFEAMQVEYLKYTWDCPLERQYILMLKAIAMYIRGNSPKECCQILQKALKETEIDWPILEIKSYYLCTQEIQVILLHEFIRESQETSLLEQLKDYIELRFTDEEEKVKVYPQCLWRLVEIYGQKTLYQKAYEVTNQAIQCLTENAIITLLEDFLEQKLFYISRYQKNEEKEELIKKQIEALRFMYGLGKYEIKTDKVYSCIHINRQVEVNISNELVYSMRLRKNMSQEKLSEDICTRETISRIERGKNSPNKKNLKKLLSKLGFENGDYLGIDTCDYEVYEKIRNFKKAELEYNYEKAQQIFSVIERSLAGNTACNRQFLEYSKIHMKLHGKNLDYKNIYVELEKILSYTLKENKGEIYRIPSKIECEILMSMVICLKHQKLYLEASHLLKSIIYQYQKSKVRESHHTTSMTLVYFNYSGILEERNELDEAEEMGKKCIQIALSCKRGYSPSIILANLSCIYQKRLGSENIAICKKLIKYSYYLQLLYGRTKPAESLIKYYFNLFQENFS